MQELAEGLSGRGHAVTVVTSYPQYNLAIDLKGTEYSEVSAEKGIIVIRIKTLPHHKVNFIVRGISQLTMPYVFLSKVKKHLKGKPDIVIVYSPPLPLAVVGEKIKNKYGAKYILNVQDIFPQNAIDLGALRNQLLITFFEKMERKAYAEADIVAVHSQGNREFLLREKTIRSEKIFVLHNWIEMEPYGSATPTGDFRRKLGLRDRFVFFFGGVIGPSQGLEVVIEAGKILREEPGLAILIVGEGTEKERLERLAKEYSLSNVIFHPFIAKHDYQALLKEVDVGVVCLTTKNKTPVVPGKLLSYMAAGLPVLALLNKESDGHQIVSEARCGYSEISDDPTQTASLMKRMYDGRDRLKDLGINGRMFAEKHFTKEKCLDQLEQLLSR